MATKEQVIQTHLAHPEWTVRQVAEFLECKPQYVQVCKERYSIPFPKAVRHHDDANSIITLGRACRRFGVTLADIAGISKREHAR